jgi:hypothetical protein
MKISAIQLSQKATIIMAGSGLLLVVLGGTTAFATHSNAQPGSVLYPFKKAWEEVSLTLTVNPAVKADKHLNIADDELKNIRPEDVHSNPSQPAIIQAKQHIEDAQKEEQKVSDKSARKAIDEHIDKESSRIKAELESNVDAGHHDDDTTTPSSARSNLSSKH